MLGGDIVTTNKIPDNDKSLEKLAIFSIVLCYVVMVLALLFISLLDTWGTQRPLDYAKIFLYPILAMIMGGLILYAMLYPLIHKSANSSNDIDTDYPILNPDFRRWKLWHDDITGVYERHKYK